MKPRNAWRRILSLILTMVIVCSLPLTTFAEIIPNTEEGTVDVETTAGTTESVDVVISIEETTTEGGGTNVQTTTTADGAVTDSNLVVDYQGSSDMTTNNDGNTVGTAESSYSVTSQDGTYTAEGGSELTRSESDFQASVDIPLEEGESSTGYGDPVGTEQNADNCPPPADTGNYDYTTETVVDQGSVTVETTDIQISTDATVFTVDADGYLVKVLTDENGNEIGTEQVLDSNGEKVFPLEYVKNETGVIQGGEDDNELFYWNYKWYEMVDGKRVWHYSHNELQDTLDDIEADKLGPDEDGNLRVDTTNKDYSYIYLGPDVSSQYLVARLFSVPEEGTDEQPAVILKDENGNEVTYYLHETPKTPGSPNASAITFDSIYLDGQEYNRVPNGSADGQRDAFVYVDENGVEHKWEISDAEGQLVGDIHLVFDVPQQFLLYDPATKQLVTTYCADFKTSTQAGFHYNIENLEDATYYSEENAGHIRAIAGAGYWGTKTSEDGSNPAGSLEYMKDLLRESGQFTEEELALLTDGVALAATQMAIWSYSNEMDGIHFMNTHYSKEPGANGQITSAYASGLMNGLHPGDTNGDGKINGNDLYYNGTETQDLFGKDASVDVLFKVFNYLVNLEPEDIQENTTSNTVLTADNFVSDLEVKVIEKADDHANNANQDATDDAYVTELSFALVVTPSTENGDDMLVKIITSNGEFTYRLAGENKEGETYETLTAKDKVYTITDLVLVEGDQQFNITLEGIQHLEQGVYLYTSEVVVDDNNNTESSQTLVGLASGNHAVSVSMTIDFTLNVDDEIVATERVWRTETREPNNPPPNPPVPFFLEFEEEGEVVIPDEEVPLADAPKTGDGSMLYTLLVILSAMALVVLNLPAKPAKRRHPRRS